MLRCLPLCPSLLMALLFMRCHYMFCTCLPLVFKYRSRAVLRNFDLFWVSLFPFVIYRHITYAYAQMIKKHVQVEFIASAFKCIIVNDISCVQGPSQNEKTDYPGSRSTPSVCSVWRKGRLNKFSCHMSEM